MRTAIHPRLSPAQVAQYQDEGYLLFQQPVFAPEHFAGLKAHFEDLLSAATARGQRPEAMDRPHDHDRVLLDYLLDDAVLDLVEALIGPDIALFSSHFICKPAGDGRRVPWHEDSAYWGDLLAPMEVVTLWLAIDPSTPANGCMRVIPGTHAHGYSQYHQLDEAAVFGTEIDEDQLDTNRAVDCVLDENQCSFHHAKLIHGSNANTSQQRRCGFTMRYMPTTCRLNIDSERGRTTRLFLARGRDHAGNVYADPDEVGQAVSS